MRQISSQLTRDKIVSELRREILFGSLKPNEELYQDKIAEELNVSRTPVREALQVLANEGLVHVRPNKIATVNEISDKFLDDFFEIRILLEKESVRRICERGLDAAPLWDYYEKAERAIQFDDFNMYNEYNWLIHQYIWHGADNIKLEQLLSQLWHTMNIDSYARETALQSNAEHKQIIESLERRDVEASYEAITLHINRSYDSIKEHMHRNL